MRVQFLIALLLLQVSCSEAEEVSLHAPVQDANLVLAVTLEKIESIGIVRSDFRLSSVSYDYVSSDWTLIFDSIEPALGGHFAFVVQDSDITSVRFIPGI